LNCAKYAVGESWTCLAQSQRNAGSKEEWGAGSRKNWMLMYNPLVDNGLLMYNLK